MLTHPRYFVTAFGDPQPPHKDVVESGVYPSQCQIRAVSS